MRHDKWSLRGLVWAALAYTLGSAAAFAAEDKIKVEVLGDGPAYKVLAHLPIEHSGRVKPIDTLAREEIKIIYGRERISLLNEDGKFYQAWEPVAALFDWSARPEFWNKQPFILVEWLPLKRAILHESSQRLLTDIAAKNATSAADKATLAKLAEADEIGAAEISLALKSTTLPADDVKDLLRLHDKLGEGHKWLAPSELDEAMMKVDGKSISFAEWVDSISAKNQEASRMGQEQADLTDLEEKGYEAGLKLGRFRALRDRNMNRFLPVLFMPRPSNQAYLVFTGEILEKGFKTRGEGMTPFEIESAVILKKYLENVASKDHHTPGENSEFDANYTDWLKNDSAWIPYAAMTSATTEQLAHAGFPVEKFQAFLKAYTSLDEAEKASPGKLDLSVAKAFIGASRDLGSTINPERFPTEGEIGREVLYNTTAPFWWAPWGYGLGAILLALSLTVRSASVPLVKLIHKALYFSGMALFMTGIGLEIYGFTLRVLITGWAPVTTMAETVIYVAAVTAVLGFVFELIYRRTFTALAATAVAAFATGLAANVTLLDPSIKSLQPVLRSNFWLTIHVMTIVSSYAAFALAWGLGLLATGYYLTATYRRTAGLVEFLTPLIPGLPILALGGALYAGSYGTINLGQFVVDWGFYPSLVFITIGALLSGGAIVALVGELLNRSLAKNVLAAAAAHERLTQRKPAYPENRELVGVGADEARPLSGDSQEADDVDPRTEAMRETAAVIKPLSNFIYRAMQVGVLLVAAGTILGGVWADYSWGRFWGWDAKEVWALVTLLVYLVPLHGRFAGWVNTFGLVMASVVCFLSVVMAWYGVNFILGVGLHAYGFTKGGSQGVVGLFILFVLMLPAGAYWRRHLSQRTTVSV